MTTQYKVVFMGPVGAGKTTAVKTITNDHSVVTDVPTTDVVSMRKVNTTVAMDYGVIDLDDSTRLHIHGCPGQKRFDFMWPIITKSAFGLVLLIDNSRNYPQRDLKQFVSAIYAQLKDTRLIVGVTRTDIKAEPALDNYEQWLLELGINAEVMRVDPRDKGQVLLLLGRLMTSTAGHANSAINANHNGITQASEADMVKFDESTLAAVGKINGITGVTLTTAMGDLLNTTIADDVTNEFIAFLSGVTPALEGLVDRGKAERIMLKSATDDSLTAIVGVDHVLGLSSVHSLSLSLLGQQVEDVVQWMD